MHHHPQELPSSRIRWIRFVYENDLTIMYLIHYDSQLKKC